MEDQKVEYHMNKNMSNEWKLGVCRGLLGLE